MTTMTPPATRKAGQQRIGETGTSTTRPGASKQARVIPGVDQARTLNTRAADRGVARADLMREVATWGLARPIDDVRRQAPVPPAPDATTPSDEKQITWVPLPGLTAQLDAQAAKVEKPNGRGTISRNELFRRHIAAWLDVNL